MKKSSLFKRELIKNELYFILLVVIMMNEVEIRKNFSNNLVRLRKLKKLNQNDLAKEFNYSNKAISKWETGETIPDIVMLKQIADFFQITLDELITSENICKEKEKRKKRKLITYASAGLSYLVAAIVFLILEICHVPNSYLCFLIAIPTSAIVLIVLNKLWFEKIYLFFSILILIWSLFLIVLIILPKTFIIPSIIIAIILTILFAIFLKIDKK